METRVLIVDDDTAIRESIQEYLTIAQFKAFAVASAEDAIDFLEKNEVDIVVTDILMNGMDGFELTDIIKKNYEAEVIVITGYSAEYSYEEAISKGASDFIFKPVRFEELNLRIKRVLRERNLARERDHMLNQLKKLAITDGLTGLYNSRYFYTQLGLEIERLKRYKHPLSLLLLDIDNFKEYNDKYGHIDGDKVLKRVGSIIQTCLRTMDTAYRYGGEEFTILLPETEMNKANFVAERIRKTLSEEKIKASNGDINSITVSIGVTEYFPNEDIKDFIKRADEAMYKSKKKGKDCVSAMPPDQHK